MKMKKIVFTIIILLLTKTSKAQMIKSFDCIKSQKDTVLIYNLKVEFDSISENKKRIELIKLELEKNYQVKTDRIISIESFIDKKYLTYRYRVNVRKE